MRRKRLFIVFFAVLFIFLGLDFVSAKTVCEYKSDDSRYTYKLVYGSSYTPTVFRNDKQFGIKINFSNKEKCPETIYIDLSHNNIFDYSRVSTYKYNLLSRSTNKVYCGREEQGRITGIPKKVPELTSTAVTIVQIAIPIILILMGSIDLFKGITAGKEDEMKKGQQMFIKRLAVGAIIFFVVIIVKFLISIVADSESITNNIVDCIDCFVDNDCKEDF